MSKPSITTIATTQTFQNWLDKTNEMVSIFRDSAMTASGSGDSTTGDATLLGEFTANTVVAWDELRMNDVSARTAGGTIDYTSPIKITGATQSVVATFQFNASGGRTRYTDGTYAWDVGMDNSTDTNFIMNSQSGEQFKLSPNGVLTVPSIITTADITIGTSITAANITSTNTLTANVALISDLTCNNIKGQFTGDIYHPDGKKIFENGGPASNIPATFTGNVNGTVSSLTNHSTDSLKEGSTNLYFTKVRVRGALTAGTGVGITADPNDSTKTLIAIGQAVNTNSNVAFKTITLNDAAATKDDKIYLNGADGSIVAEGNITAYGSVSDITTKENIVPIDGALEKIQQLGGYLFNYKGDDTPMTGVMAQELLKVMPEAVYEVEKDGEKKYAVRHGNLVGLLIEAIKELSAKLDK